MFNHGALQYEKITHYDCAYSLNEKLGNIYPYNNLTSTKTQPKF